MTVVAIAWKDFRRNFRSWFAVLLTASVVGVVFCLAFGLVFAGARSEGEAQQAYATLGGTAVGFAVLSGVIALLLVTGVSVSLQRRTVALWQLVGVSPRQAFAVIVVEIVLVCGCAGVVAAALGVVLWSPFTLFVASADLPPSPALAEPVPVGAVCCAVGVTVVVGVLGGVRSARRASRVDPILAVRQTIARDDGRHSRLGSALRTLFALVLLVGTGVLYWVVSQVAPMQDASKAADLSLVYVGMGMLLLLDVALVGRACTVGAVRVLGALVPGRGSLGWFLAVQEATARPSHTRALVLPVAIAAGGVGVIYGWISKLTATLTALGSGTGDVNAPPGQMALLFGGAVAIACVAASAVIYASANERAADAALVIVSGSGTAVAYTKALAETVLYTVATGLIAYAVVWINELAISAALAAGPIPSAHFAAPTWQPLIVITAGGTLTLLALMLVTTSAVRRDPVAVISRSPR